MSHFTQLQDWYKPIPKLNTGFKSWFEMQRYQTTKELRWETVHKHSNIWIVVPEGYVFDVSIPLPLWPIMSPSNPRFHRAACLHDYLLEVHKLDRVAAAVAFSEGLRATGVWRLKRLVMVLAVIAYHFR